MPSNIVVPEMGESIVDARVARWLKNEGDPVQAGEALVELETDKVDVEVSATQNGVLGAIAQQAGADVKIGEVLGVIEEATSAKASVAKGSASAPQPASAVPATPSARRAAREQNVDLASVEADGPRVTKADVAAFAGAATAAPASAPKAGSAGAPTAASASAPKAPAGTPAGAPGKAAPTGRPAPVRGGDRQETRQRK